MNLMIIHDKVIKTFTATSKEAHLKYVGRRGSGCFLIGHEIFLNIFDGPLNIYLFIFFPNF